MDGSRGSLFNRSKSFSCGFFETAYISRKKKACNHSICKLLIVLTFYLRRERDSNPRYAFDVYTLSRRAPSTTRTPLLFSLPFGERKNIIKNRISEFMCDYVRQILKN